MDMGEKKVEIAHKLHINSSKIKLLARKFKYIYCKYLHKEKKNAERKNTSSLLSML